MEERLKKRLLGAVVLVSLLVIFVPMLIDDGTDRGSITKTNIPPRPKQPDPFESRVLPVEEKNLTRPAEEDRSSPPLPARGESAEGGPSGKAPRPSKENGATATREGLAAWIIQIGSFSSKENADKLVDRLKAKKFPAFVEQASVNKKLTYRVRVGPEVDRKLADEMAAQIAKEFNLKGSVIHYP